ncbi:primase-helicase zinc-binding domain-containing protein [Aeromonas rivipollensis]|uniref:primase-helicase zinc-binding domain-containing protein n=1 Tax=Aeromonas rivipollensis TaxID=948519 RepID=UPI00259DE8A5|nr:primase-helicase zinc-binding domain-containing protein [Aeromonas rivipollensis]MDM5057413.1 toprim domain-containing protein [Aeromonas rivipollensis]
MSQPTRIVSDVLAAAVGHWPELLTAVGIDTPHHGKHGPCPACGGRDRFRLDDKGGRGTFICSQCGSGDGLDLVCRVTNKTLKEAAALVAPLVGLSAGGLAPAERERIHQQQQVRAEAERKQDEQRCRKAVRRAVTIMRDCEPGQAPYLVRKHLHWPHGTINRTLIREGGENFPAESLVVPLINEATELVNVQLIRDDGTKRYLAGGQKAGAYHRIEGGELVAVVEGYATGLSVYLATGATVYCAMDCGNLAKVAAIACRQHPEARILLCGDNDEATKGNPGRAKAEQAAAAVGGLVALPPVSGDWNDHHQTHGLTATKAAIMSAGTTQATSQPQEAGQEEGANVIPLHPELLADTPKHQPPTPMIDKMSASQRAVLLVERLGLVAINIEAERVYHYDGCLWTSLSDTELRREMAAIFTAHGAPFSDKGIGTAVSTMKLMIPVMGQPTQELIGFANGVYDMAARRFRPHSSADGLLNHNGIEYAPPHPSESIEQHAPNFTRWLSHAAEDDSAKMARIKAALYMVLANRYDWQLFLEVTGEGGSGKSIFARIATLLAGGPRNTGSGNMASLDTARGRAQFVDKRLIALPDQSKYIGDGSGIKAITGGDMVEIDGKYEKQYGAVIQAVVLVTNNEPMIITERNGGVSRRRVIFTFNRVVGETDKDPRLGDKIAAELPVVIRHLLALFAEPERACRLLLEQRNSGDALTIKRATDPVIDLCGLVEFLDEPRGLMMGGNPEIKREPRRYLYHLYLAFMDYHGLGRPLSVQGFTRAVKAAAKEYGTQYSSRTIKGKAQTNVTPSETAELFMPQAAHAGDE